MTDSSPGCARGETKTAPARERPIILTGPMVQAILAGRKTQTRRVVSYGAVREPGLFMSVSLQKVPDFDPESGEWYEDGGMWHKPCPHGVPGDRLWVRETWRSWNEDCDDGSGASHGWDVPCGLHCRQVYVAYAATPREGYRPEPDKAAITYLDASTPLECYHESLTGPWHPSIFMPRWASRITLEITDVRVQRLQEISEDDAEAEGAIDPDCDGECGGSPCINSRPAFRRLWDSINAKRGFGWDTNPFCWAITFRRIS